MKRSLALLVALAAALVLAACGNHQTNQAQVREFNQQRQDQASLEIAQPVPHFNFSQKRQNLTEIESAEAHGVQTTSFFFNLGERDPIQTCPSIGAPIPTTTQLTNPSQPLKDNASPLNNGGGNLIVSQMDPTGVYSGDSSGTYVMCVSATGQAYADYWEGYVQTVFGPATWNASAHQIQLVGPPSFKFSRGQ